ncbi:Hypothetical predicted protein [Marmota monax]|uniref:Uncharacterized protein n=1 Tax=Marmota monax TaxID=9995 RepID=A0A5E4A1T8_MARMO|nr:hypothetical protein GHT09_001109 [Marmota monax]VTJ51118.1 Hypothetical predicted protein [Marmota monax]
MTAHDDGATQGQQGRKSSEPGLTEAQAQLQHEASAWSSPAPSFQTRAEWFVTQEEAQPSRSFAIAQEAYEENVTPGFNPDSKELSPPSLLLATKGLSDKDTEGLRPSLFLEKPLQRGKGGRSNVIFI